MKCKPKKNANVIAKPVNAVLSVPVNAARILAAAENILVAVVVVSASYTWSLFFSSGIPATVIPWAIAAVGVAVLAARV